MLMNGNKRTENISTINALDTSGKITEILFWAQPLPEPKRQLYRKSKLLEQPVQRIWHLVLSEPELKGLQLPGSLEAPYHTLATMKLEYPDGGTEWCRFEKGHKGISYGSIPESWAKNYGDERAPVCYLLRQYTNIIIPSEKIFQIAVENAESTHANHYMEKLANQDANFATVVNQYLFSSCWLCIDRIAELVDKDLILERHFNENTGDIKNYVRFVKE